MSKAFTREENEGPEIPDLPPLASVLPEGAKNYVTAAGAQQLRDELEQLTNEKRPALVALGQDPEAKQQLAVLDRRIAQLERSLRSSEVVSRPGDADVVRFGATVTVREENGEESIYRIVGVDETDFERGWISWQSPLARALLEARRGESVRFHIPSGEQELEVMAVSYE